MRLNPLSLTALALFALAASGNLSHLEAGNRKNQRVNTTTPEILPNDDTLTFESLDKPPRAITFAEPVYPKKLLKQGITGRVIIEFVLSPEGRVVSAKAVSKSHPDFMKAAEKAVMKSIFEPAESEGRKVSVRLRVPISFKLEEP